MIVKYTPPGGAGGNAPLPHDAYYSAYFYIHAFNGGAGTGQSLVAFTHDGVRVKVLLQEDFSAAADLPLFAKNYVEVIPDPANQGQTLSHQYAISASAMTTVWQAEFAGPAYAETALTQAQAEHLALLTDRIQQVRPDMISAKNQQGSPPPVAEPPPSPGVANGRGFFVVEEYAPDSDGDGIPDAIELAFWNSSAFLADSDGDGVPDAWDAYPMDPSAWQFVPGDPNDHTAPTLYLTAPIGAVSQ